MGALSGKRVRGSQQSEDSELRSKVPGRQACSSRQKPESKQRPFPLLGACEPTKRPVTPSWGPVTPIVSKGLSRLWDSSKGQDPPLPLLPCRSLERCLSAHLFLGKCLGSLPDASLESQVAAACCTFLRAKLAHSFQRYFLPCRWLVRAISLGLRSLSQIPEHILPSDRYLEKTKTQTSP